MRSRRPRRSRRARRSRCVALVLAPLALTAAALPAPAGAAGWSGGVPTSAAGATASAPRVAADAKGGVTAAWLRDGKVQAGVRGANGAFTAADVSGTGAQAPQLAVGADGRAILAWVRDDAVEASIRPSADAPFGAPAVLSRAGAGDVRAAIDGAGAASVLWIRGNNVEIASRAAGSPAWPAEHAVFSESGPSGPALAAAPGGRLVAVWSASGGAMFVLRTATATAGDAGSWEPAMTVESVDDVAGGGVTADLAADGTNDVTGVWDRHDGSSRHPQVVAGRRLGGAPFTDIAGISGGEVDDQAASPRPALAANVDGDAAAVWLHRQEDVFTVEIARRAGGAAFDPPAAISAAGADGVAPDAAVDATGRAAAVWVRQGRVEALRTPGAPGTPSALSDAGAGAPQVTFDHAGNAVAVWARDGRIETAAFDLTAPSVTLVHAPASAATGEYQVFEAAGADGESPADIHWDFGDGQTATGAAAKHRFLNPGSYTVVATAVDGGGNTATATATVTVTGDPVTDTPTAVGTPPGTPGTPGDTPGPGLPRGDGARDRRAPRLSRVVVAPRRVRSGRAAKLALRLDEAARVVVRVQRGRRTLRGHITAPLAAGRRTIKLPARLDGRRLAPARYTLVVVATDAAGNASRATRITLRVVR